MGLGGEGGQRRRKGRAEEKGKCRNRGTNITVVQRGFLFKLYPFGHEGGEERRIETQSSGI